MKYEKVIPFKFVLLGGNHFTVRSAIKVLDILELDYVDRHH